MAFYSGQGSPADTQSLTRCKNCSWESGGGTRPGPGFHAHAMKWSVAACSMSRCGEKLPLVFVSLSALQIWPVVKPCQTRGVSADGMRHPGAPGGACGAITFVSWWQLKQRI